MAHAVLQGGRVQARSDQIGGVESRRLSGRRASAIAAMCHTAINALGGSSESQAFEGGLIPMQNWYAPSLTSNKEAGLGDWTIEEITDYLRKGVSSRGAVYGPMAEVVYNSLQYLNDDDTRAMAIYLKSLAQGTSPEKPAPPLPSAESSLLLSASASRSTTANAPAAMARRASACRRIIRRSPATSRSRWCRRSTRSGWCSMAAIRRARQAIRCPTACRRSRTGCPTTRSRRSSPISGPPGAIAAQPVSARQANELRAATLN